MSLKRQIKSLLQEAEIYRNQGLIDEAKEKYKAASVLIQDNTHLKNKGRLLSAINTKLADLGDDKDDHPAPGALSPQLSEKAQNLIKQLFSFSDSKNEDDAALEGALALAKFGQIDRALTELNKLIQKDSMRIVAAKNIIRCHLAVGSADGAVVQFKQWLESDAFTSEQLVTIRNYLSTSLENKGIETEIPHVEQLPENESQNADDAEFMEEDEQDSGFLDITSIGITFEQGPQKGKMIEFDVNFQSGNLLSLIIPDKDKSLVETLEDGVRLNNIQFFSPLAIFKGTGIVSSRTMIKNGPKKGDICLDIKILNQ